MPNTTLRLDDDLLDDLDAEAAERDVSRSEYMRTILRRRHEHERVQAECDRLQRRVNTLIQQRDEHSELVEYVEHERELQRQERERRQSNAFQRFAWWLFGEPADEIETQEG